MQRTAKPAKTARSKVLARRLGLILCASSWLFFVLTVASAEPSAGPGPRPGEGPSQAAFKAMARAEQALALEEPEIAESALRDVLREGWLLLGQLDLAAGDPASLDTAQQAFERALEASVASHRPMMLLSLVHLRRGDVAEAQQMLRDLVSRDPTDGAARRLLAQALVSIDDTAAAVQELEEGWAAAPEDLETAFALATGYVRLGQLERAEQLFRQVAKVRPQAATRVLIGRMYRDFGQFEKATAWLEEALTVDAAVRRARYYLGTVALLRFGMDGLDPAIELFEQELKLAPDDPMTHLYLGSALVESHLFERAIPLLERAAQWPPASFDAERYLGRALLGLGRPAEAVEALERALEKAREGSQRDLAEMHYQLGTAKRQLGRAEEAEGHFAQSKILGSALIARHREKFASFVRDEIGRPSADDRGDPVVDPFAIGTERVDVLNPQQQHDVRQRILHLVARASMDLGVLAARGERFERAAEHFERAAEADPELDDIDRSLGMALFKAGLFERAVEPLERALAQQAPENAAAVAQTLAVATLNAKKYERTIALLENDAGRESSPALQLTYAVALVRAGRTADAAPIFDQLAAKGDAWPALHVVLGQAKAQDGDFEAAEKSLHRALELDPKVTEARVSLGEIYLRQGRLEEAVTVLQGELEARPQNLEARYLLATVLDLHRRPEEAEAHLRALLRAAPRHADARYLLGKILLAKGDAASAVEQLKAAADIAPEDANIHYQLGQAYQRSGQREAAERHFEIFRRLKAEQRETPS